MNIICLSSKGVLYTDARPLLFDQSVTLLRRNEKKAVVRGDLFELTITNTGDRGRIGTFHGPLFDAVIETDRGTTKVNYLVDDGDIAAVLAAFN